MITDLSTAAESKIPNIRNTSQELYDLVVYHKYSFELFAKNLDGQSSIRLNFTYIRDTELEEVISFRNRSSDKALLRWNQPPITDQSFWYNLVLTEFTNYNDNSEFEGTDSNVVK